MYQQDRFFLYGQPISAKPLDEVMDIIAGYSDDELGRYICCRDVSSLVALAENGPLCDVHRRATFVLPDGMPLVWLGKLRGKTVARCAGPDLMQLMLEHPTHRHLKHMLWGGQPGVVEQLKARFSNANIVAAETPVIYPDRPAHDGNAIEIIAQAKPDIVWVGLSSPKQDYWMLAHYKHLSCTLIGVGAAFDFHAGRQKRAPTWMQKAGLEWTHRIVHEPKRLFSRYAQAVPRFIRLVFQDLTHNMRRARRK